VQNDQNFSNNQFKNALKISEGFCVFLYPELEEEDVKQL
jgi:hypothetical protein